MIAANDYLMFIICQASTIYSQESPYYYTLHLTHDNTKAKRASHFSNATEVVSSRAVINGHVGGRNSVLTWHSKDKDKKKVQNTVL